MDELKPCPFCGSRYVVSVYCWIVKCCRCGAHGAAGQTRKEAIEAWNRRADDGE